MIELRWHKELAGEYFDGIMKGSKVYKDKALQYRTMANPAEIGVQEPIWSEWEEVPLVWSKEL